MEDYMAHLIELIDLSQNKPLNEIVYEGLRKAIIQGVIPVGERINEQAYSEYMNISRTPIRNAIDKLKFEGILEYIPNFGVVVKRVTVADAEEIYKIRIALEILASTTAMHLMTHEDHRQMSHLLALTEEANKNDDVKQVISCFVEFNTLIFRFARMPRLEIMVARLQQYLIRFRDISLLNKERRSRAIEEHRIIHYALKKKDEALISMIVTEHLNYSKNFIIKEIVRFEEEKKDVIRGIYGKS